MNAPRIVRADYADPAHGAAIVELLDIYARDPMGGATSLSEEVKAALVPGLAASPCAFSLLVFASDEAGGQAIGLVNCFQGFSTFAAKPLVNIHDIVVQPEWRGRGVARALFAAVEAIAAERGACKVTLEVLNGNSPAKALYASMGYGDYVLDPHMGNALFWQKRLAA